MARVSRKFMRMKERYPELDDGDIRHSCESGSSQIDLLNALLNELREIKKKIK